jgi:pimeloyl-ACP methyl ester carboxylesterase
VALKSGYEIATVETEGSGSPLLLIHGFTDTSRSFSLLEPYLRGHHLIMPDLLGHGASSRPDKDYSIAEMADDLAELIVHERPILIGHSMGAMIALVLTKAHPELVSGIVTIGGSLKLDLPDHHPVCIGVNALIDPIDPMQSFFTYWHGCRKPIDASFMLHVAKEAAAMPAHLWQALLAQLRAADLTATANHISVPSLVIYGADDALFEEKYQMALHCALRARGIVRLEQCEHNPHWEAPEQVARAINEFIASVATSSSAA